LKRTQKFGLRGKAQVRDLVEEHCPAVGLLKLPDLSSPTVSALLVPEQLFLGKPTGACESANEAALT